MKLTLLNVPCCYGSFFFFQSMKAEISEENVSFVLQGKAVYTLKYNIRVQVVFN